MDNLIVALLAIVLVAGVFAAMSAFITPFVDALLRRGTPPAAAPTAPCTPRTEREIWLATVRERKAQRQAIAREIKRDMRRFD